MLKIINSNIFSETAKLSHHSVLSLILKYEEDLKSWGTLETIKEKTKGRNALVYKLNENQVKYLILLMKNSKEANELKKAIINNESILEKLETMYKNKNCEGYVYILQKENKLIKIGVSINPQKRINAIRTHSAENFENVFISKKTKEYKCLERKMHQVFKKERVMGEWFNVDFNLAKDFLESAL